ncbi:MAG TPA: hypothetical protein VJ870_15655 [Amycolatopsis sp.]|nr:hypothetical protein [Amycolatopsis sp.]
MADALRVCQPSRRPNVIPLEPLLAGPTGTVYLRYGLADGTQATGDG